MPFLTLCFWVTLAIKQFSTSRIDWQLISCGLTSDWNLHERWKYLGTYPSSLAYVRKYCFRWGVPESFICKLFCLAVRLLSENDLSDWLLSEEFCVKLASVLMLTRFFGDISSWIRPLELNSALTGPPPLNGGKDFFWVDRPCLPKGCSGA